MNSFDPDYDIFCERDHETQLFGGHAFDASINLDRLRMQQIILSVFGYDIDFMPDHAIEEIEWMAVHLVANKDYQTPGRAWIVAFAVHVRKHRISDYLGIPSCLIQEWLPEFFD